MAERFIVNEEEKVIYVKLGMLTDKDKRAIKDYVDLFGYQIKKYVPIEKTEEEKIYTREKIEAYLLKYGTKEEQNKFVSVQEEIAIDKKTNKPKVWEKDTENHKKGEPKKKGFIGGLKWFKDNFQSYPEAPTKKENN